MCFKLYATFMNTVFIQLAQKMDNNIVKYRIGQISMMDTLIVCVSSQFTSSFRDKKEELHDHYKHRWSLNIIYVALNQNIQSKPIKAVLTNQVSLNISKSDYGIMDWCEPYVLISYLSYALLIIIGLTKCSKLFFPSYH